VQKEANSTTNTVQWEDIKEDEKIPATVCATKRLSTTICANKYTHKYMS
jgi:hypothetical protein